MPDELGAGAGGAGGGASEGAGAPASLGAPDGIDGFRWGAGDAVPAWP
jgi:hypothetical protein